MAAVAVEPESTHFVPKEQEPAPDAVTAIWYCVFQFHVSVESFVIVNVTFVAVPDAGTLPVPVQPVQAKRDPCCAAGVATDARITELERCWEDPIAGVHVPWAEETTSDFFVSQMA